MKIWIETLILIGLMLGILVGGFWIGKIYTEDMYSITGNKVDGMWIKGGNLNETQAEEYVQKRDTKGDWICVNIRNMAPKRALEVCNHEVGHEIFAEICEKDPELCFKTIESIKQTTN